MNLNQCRLCCKTDNVAVGVFDVIENNLCEKISLCFGVQIKPDDPITKTICRCCYYFTNSAYEHRIISQQNDSKLKREYEEVFASKNIIQNKITQNDFLNNLKLTNKEDVKTYNAPVVHPSIKTIKRKYPNINIPKSCFSLDMEPFVDILNPKKIKQKNKDTWSISTKNSSSALVFTMVKTDIKEEYISDSEVNKKIVRRRLSSTSSNCSNVSSLKLTRSSARVLLRSPNTSEKSITYSDNESENKSPSKPFTCQICERSFILSRNLKKHKCIPVQRPQLNVKEHSDSPKDSELNKSKLVNPILSQNTSETFKSPNIIPPMKKNANTAQLKETNTDLKTLLEINEKINDSISKLSKDKTNNKVMLNESQEVPKNKESLKNNEENTINKENLNKSAEIPATTSVDKNTPEKNESLNISDLLVEGQKVNAFLCLTCNQVFDTSLALKYHKRYTHKLSLRCDKCTKKFAVVEKLMKHKEIHENFKRKREASAKAKADTKVQTDEAANKEFKENEESNDSIIAFSNEESSSSEEAPKSKETAPEKEEMINLSPETLKRAANLPQLSVTLEPLAYTQSDISLPQPTRGRMVARKRTNGALFTPNSNKNHNILSNSDSSLSSSDDDDDCKITEVFMGNQINKKEMSPAHRTETERLLIDTALAPQSIIEDNNQSTRVEATLNNVSVAKVEVQNNVLSSNEVFVIDSDSDTEVIKNKPSKPNTQLTVQLNKVTKLPSPVPETTVRVRRDSSSPIIISANSEECQNSGSLSNNTKITNELNYINYLYNKCSYDEKSVMNGSQYWTLHHLKKLVKHSIIPIEINNIIDQNVSIKYATTKSKSTPTVPLIPWNFQKAIDLNVGVNNKTAKTKQTTQQVTKNQETAKNQKASIKVPIPSALKPKIINGPKTNQFTTKYVPSSCESPPTNSQNQTNTILPSPIQQIQSNVMQAQQFQSNLIQMQQTQEHSLLQTTQNNPNKNVANNQARSLLKNALTTNTQQILYTYVPTTSIQPNFVTIPTTTESKQGIDQPFVINMTNMNKNPTIVFQQIEQPNFINITQPAFFTTSENGNSAIYLKQQTNMTQETETILSDTPPTKENEETINEVSSTEKDSGGPRPMIRIKSLSELTAKPSEASKEEKTSYLNVFANYVNTINPS